MKKFISTFILCTVLISSFVLGQSINDKYIDKVKTLDSTLKTLYSVISGEAEELRNWELFRYLFRDDARLIPIGRDSDGNSTTNYMSSDDYVERAGAWLEKNGFHEKEINRVVEAFGKMTHVFSTYESYRSINDQEPFARGINSIQLLHDGTRWWIINIYWFAENEQNPIPSKYLPQ